MVYFIFSYSEITCAAFEDKNSVFNHLGVKPNAYPDAVYVTCNSGYYTSKHYAEEYVAVCSPEGLWNQSEHCTGT